ncbi:protein-L-isoaspartate(D-aspartate) O-methyltransferase [Candidatus Woesearchaeota archaeon]|nr:protein-L-isoaspartate(D-aspartate) O-methyltransferase [Candidatus Woesearchaeota archaeon]
MDKEQLVDYWKKSGTITNKEVLNAFLSVKRENFVLEEYAEDVYEDVPLLIHEAQTISQPTTVAIMLQALEVKKGMKILEIGTGSGYNAALLGKLAGSKGSVITIEIHESLVEFAKENLKKEKITNVCVIKSDGSEGYSEESPYDRIICTAAAPKIPEALIKQLKVEGILIIPVGPLSGQHMLKLTKTKKGLEQEEIGDFIFVPLTGKFGFD